MELALPLWFEVGSLVALTLILGFDVFLAFRRPHIPSTRESALWIGFYVALAIVFALLHTGSAAMIGASGGVFGLLGAWAVFDHRETRRRTSLRRAALRSAGICIAVLLLSVLDAALRQSALAWQAHLGGFLAGAAAFQIYRARRPRSQF